jgi:hypothetical protein
MNSELKRLSIVATCCFFPGGLLGLWLYKKSPSQAVIAFRWSIYTFMLIVCAMGLFTVIKAGSFIPVLGSFY